MMTEQLCKKHGKPRTVIYERKMPKGGMFKIVGCADCAAAAGGLSDKPAKKPEKKPPSKVTRIRRY
jgi:hypothetical protein